MHKWNINCNILFYFPTLVFIFWVLDQFWWKWSWIFCRTIVLLMFSLARRLGMRASLQLSHQRSGEQPNRITYGKNSCHRIIGKLSRGYCFRCRLHRIRSCLWSFLVHYSLMEVPRYIWSFIYISSSLISSESNFIYSLWILLWEIMHC